MINFFKNKYVELKVDQCDRYMEGYNYSQSVMQAQLKQKDDKISQLESKVESLTLAMIDSKYEKQTVKASRK